LLVFVVTTLYVCACIDRQILPLLVEPIAHDLGATDAQLGLLIGLGFSLFYSCVSLPAGVLVDRTGRRGLLGAAVGGWSLLTLLSGLAGNYWQLFLGRAGVGMAEGVIAPASYSLIRENVPPEARGRAFGVFSMAPYLGGSLALIAGGALMGAADRGAFDDVFLLGGLRHWQIVLVILGLVGAPLTLLPLVLPRDVRGAHSPQTSTDMLGFGDALRYMREHRRLYVPLIAYTTLSTSVVFANGPWLPALVMRRFGVSVADVGYVYGLVKIVAAPLGLLLVGIVLDRLGAAKRGFTVFGVVTSCVVLIAFAAVPFAPGVTATFAIKGLGLIFSGAYAAIGAVVVARITPPQLVGKVTAVYLLFQSVLGTGLGPVFAGVLSAQVLGATIGTGMMITTLALGIPALAAFVLMSRRLPTSSVRSLPAETRSRIPAHPKA
jgi:MFS family permease